MKSIVILLLCCKLGLKELLVLQNRYISLLFVICYRLGLRLLLEAMVQRDLVSLLLLKMRFTIQAALWRIE